MTEVVVVGAGIGGLASATFLARMGFNVLVAEQSSDVRAGAQPYLLVFHGDAAHAMAPNLGQGANSALVDAGVLASELDRRDGISEALAAYDSRRSVAVQQVQTDARRLARIAHFSRARQVRNAVVRLMPPRIAVAEAKRAQQVDVPSFRVELRAPAATRRTENQHDGDDR